MVQPNRLSLTRHQPSMRGGIATPLVVPIGALAIEADLRLPAAAKGLVIFAPGGSSSRKSVRDQFVARAFEPRGLGSLSFDALTTAEHRQDALDQRFRHDVRFLARRLGLITDWVLAQPFASSLPIGYFASRSGAAGAIIAAAERSTSVRAVVSRGGRPDLAGAALLRLVAPTLLLADHEDDMMLKVNELARRRLPSAKLVIVPDAGHLSDETAALDSVAQLASDWFLQHLPSAGDAAPETA